ncbi:carbohydrate ABC transporter permease [Treponema phagedenis]|uniref:Carbohydrate ABC transporter permease n=1 Tax=Treponema phagedenis TaxID=162 RepID=A0A0B7H0K3_TREPH|nr:carbohydrate ABC transporter permease [Treponema phagedenis]NVP23419.1 carbohydrate ABC transporter permease [Treponema phagedenis]QEJ95637.1 carbohydrate ABC transporter permease [Treponema phagedenis]QEJ98561.1 carbohydrate ABC transporter permease [Treponema phagedenis]QEK04066.1 carbohydrate ABC transporter permease [Treponema phagedenis]QEK09682.1 carbohydrate ABC transporter permease [Treponema phagedenis]
MSIFRKLSNVERNNYLQPPASVLAHLLFLLLGLLCVIPFIFVIIISFSSPASIQEVGYSFFPTAFSLEAYRYVFEAKDVIFRAYGVSIFITITGTALGLLLNSSIAYALSRPNFRYQKFFTLVVLIPMLFNGGLISFYLIMTKFLHLKDSLLALILPSAVSSFYIMVLRTFFKTTIPESIIDSARIDGAGQFHIFFKMILPISLPALATIGLFLTFGYWNEWFNALLFIEQPTKVPLQALLMRIEQNLSFITDNMSMLGGYGKTINLPSETMKMAIVVLVAMPIACAYPFFQRYFISGLTIGSIKG